MRNQLQEIRTRKGKTNANILLIAPHGHSDDDENTGYLAREIQKRLDCHAIINEVYRKPKEVEPGKFEEPNVKNQILDLNDYTQAKLHKNYIKKIKKLIADPENTCVVWIHGIADQNLAAEANKLQADGLKGLVCFGQPDRHSMDQEKALTLANHLNEKNFNVGFTSDDAENYRGWARNNMNQFFKNEKNGLQGVQSVQLELGYTGVRDDERIPEVSQVIAEAIAKVAGVEPIPEQEPCVDEQLVATAFNEIQKLIEDNNAMSTVGHYLIATFYAGNYEWAKSKKGYKDKSLKTVIENLTQNGHAPGKTWFYNAVKLAVDEQEFSSFRTYGMIGHSHKVYLTHVNDLAEKKKLIEETVDKKLTVKELRIRIGQIKSAAKAGKRSGQQPSLDEIKTMSSVKREKAKAKIQKRKDLLATLIANMKDKLKQREKDLKASEKLLQQIDQLDQPQEKAETKKKAA